jgi:membrane protein YqaA with SNARE-associated domain
MNHFNHRIFHWLEATALATGGLGMCLVGFIDSATTLPVISDILLIEVSAHRPSHMPYYVVMTTIGSVLGGVLLYMIARKGQEALYRKRAGKRAERIRLWVARNGFLTVLLGALLPPPMPFKLIILAAGAAEMPLRPFIFALTLARVIRFSAEGYVAVKYGSSAWPFFEAHQLSATFWTVVLGLAFYIAARFAMRPSKEERAER